MSRTQPKAEFSIHQLMPVFKAVFSTKTMDDWLQKSKKRFYNRLYTPMVIIWCLVFQRLNYDHSCDAVVSHVGSGAMDDLDDRHEQTISQRIKSESTSAFCKARQRLPLEILQTAVEQTAAQSREYLGEKALWHGHRVTMLDGTTILLHPENELMQHYGQHINQHGPCYWVEMRAVSAFCPYTGALLNVKDGSLHESEQALAKDVLEQLPPDSICIGDSNFGVFSVVQAARHNGQFVLFRLTASRARALSKHKMHPGEDIAMQWEPSYRDKLNSDMSTAPIAGRHLYVRLERDGFRPVDLYLFTTLLDALLYPVTELVALYGKRWHVELNLRYVKATLDMDLLAGKSIDMVRKELWAGMLAYNLIRTFMAMAAHIADLSPLTLSFTKCWRRIQHVLALVHRITTALHFAEMIRNLISRLARCKLTERLQFRLEPRAVRRRPDSYPFLKGSRAEARQCLREQLSCPTKS